MARLSKRIDTSNIINCKVSAALNKLQEISKRLADYEDIGLTPDQLREVDKLYLEKCKELAAYKKLEEQDLLLQLPCRVGDKLYLPFSNLFFIREVTVTGFEIGNHGLIIMNDFALFSVQQIGKTVFLTKAEAEAALTERKEVAEEAIPEAEYEKPNPAEGAVIRHRPTKEELARDLSNGLMAIEIAKKYGYKSPSSITTLMRKYGLTAKGKKGATAYANSDKAALMEFIEGRIDEVKALYTNGPFTLEKLAVEYSADQKLLHEVLGAKGLLKGKKFRELG